MIRDCRVSGVMDARATEFTVYCGPISVVEVLGSEIWTCDDPDEAFKTFLRFLGAVIPVPISDAPRVLVRVRMEGIPLMGQLRWYDSINLDPYPESWEQITCTLVFRIIDRN